MPTKLYVLQGKDKGRSFDLYNGESSLIGRSPKNDMQLLDKAISRYHLKIEVKENRYLVTDLNSKNGTLIRGKRIPPKTEIEIKEGVPITIGMSILGIGEVCMDCLSPYFDALGICSEILENDNELDDNQVEAFHKCLEIIYKASEIMTESVDCDEIYQKIMDCIENYFEGIDRCAIILTDNAGKIENVIYRPKKDVNNPESAYNREIVEQVLLMKKEFMISDSYVEEDEDEELIDTLKLKRIRSAMCVPMSSFIRTLGVIYLDSHDKPIGFRNRDLQILKDLGNRAALAIENTSML